MRATNRKYSTRLMNEPNFKPKNGFHSEFASFASLKREAMNTEKNRRICAKLKETSNAIYTPI